MTTPVSYSLSSFLFFQITTQNLSEEKRAEYGTDYYDACATLTSNFINGCWEPVHVVNKIMKATTLCDPMPQYIVGMDGRFQLVPLVYNTPLNFQFFTVLNTIYRTLVPAVVRTSSKPAVALPTTTGNGKGNGIGGRGH